MENKCENCKVRKWFVNMFDVHFDGIDCPCKCDQKTEEKPNEEKSEEEKSNEEKNDEEKSSEEKSEEEKNDTQEKEEGKKPDTSTALALIESKDTKKDKKKK